MYFDAQAYAEGITNSAAGSTIEFFVTTLDYTIQTLDEHMGTLAGNIVGNGRFDAEDDKYQQLMEDLNETKKNWEALRRELADNPLNEELSFDASSD